MSMIYTCKTALLHQVCPYICGHHGNLTQYSVFVNKHPLSVTDNGYRDHWPESDDPVMVR